MKTNRVREMLQAAEPTVGCFLGLGSPNLAELMAHVGFDWIVVEAEHTPLGPAEIERILMAMSGADTVPLVRLLKADPFLIQQTLDMGALGVVVPMVRNAEEAKAVVDACRYPPQGTRGFGPLRATHYLLDMEDYFAKANENIIVALIIENKEAVQNLEAIANVPGVDVLIFGPFDCCLSMGLDPMRQPYPEIEKVMQRMLAIGRECGVACGIHAWSPEEAQQRLVEGYTFLSYSTDIRLLTTAAQAGLAAFRQGVQLQREKQGLYTRVQSKS